MESKIVGGTGFRMQRLQGQGTEWVELNGEVVVYAENGVVGRILSAVSSGGHVPWPSI
jgi:uncharacterized protein (AIM24 family)